MLPTNVVDAAPVAHSRIYTLSDVAKHASPKDCWCIYDNKVFDVSLTFSTPSALRRPRI